MRWIVAEKGGKNARYYKKQASAFLRAAYLIVTKDCAEVEEQNGWAKFAAGTKGGKFTIWGHFTDDQKQFLKMCWQSKAKANSEAAA